MRLIDADELKIEITKQIAYFKDKANTTSINQDKLAYCLKASGLELAKSLIDNAPTIETSYDLYREETCERKAHCYDYEYWHCIGCHGCKADVRGGKQ